jgi:hypothetical protein
MELSLHNRRVKVPFFEPGKVVRIKSGWPVLEMRKFFSGKIGR